MPERFHRIAVVTPYSWSVPHPVNDHIAELATGMVELRAREGDSIPDVVVIAPSLNPKARRVTRRALRDLARGVDAATALGEPALHATATRSRRGGPGGAFPLLAVGLPIGHASVALRASLRLLLERGGIDLVHAHDPLESDLTRVVVRHWPGFTVATWHEVPSMRVLKGLQERIADQIDLSFVTSDELRQPLSGALGGNADEILSLAPISAPARGAADATAAAVADATSPGAIVLGRGIDDDALVRSALRELASGDDAIVLLSRWGAHHGHAASRGSPPASAGTSPALEGQCQLKDPYAVVGRTIDRRSRVGAHFLQPPLMRYMLPASSRIASSRMAIALPDGLAMRRRRVRRRCVARPGSAAVVAERPRPPPGRLTVGSRKPG